MLLCADLLFFPRLIARKAEAIVTMQNIPNERQFYQTALLNDIAVKKRKKRHKKK